MNLSPDLESVAEEIEAVVRKHGVRGVWVIGKKDCSRDVFDAIDKIMEAAICLAALRRLP